jgi:pyruvate kinase (EC 2.7.1.40)
MKKHTKIVASISDRRCDVDFISKLYDAGMNVVRMNTAHAGAEGLEQIINNVRAVSNKIAILIDTKGPEVRTTACAEPIHFTVGERVRVIGNPDVETTHDCIAVSYPNFVRDLSEGGEILVDDGDLDLHVVKKYDDYLEVEVMNETTLGSRKSVNVPGVRINLPSLTEKDRKTFFMPLKRILILLRIHLFVTNRTYWIFRKYWISTIVI